MDKEKNVVLNFKMDGQVQYAKTLREINAVMNTAAKEYKNHVAAMGDDAKASEKLTAEKKKLEIQMEAARKRTEMLRTQYEAMAKNTKTTTGQLAQMYSKLLDSENAEIKLQKSLERVNGGLSEQALDARDAKEKLDELKNQSNILESEQKKLTSSFKMQNAELGSNATEAEKVELAQKQLASQMELTDRVVKNLEQQLEQAKKVYGDNSIQVNKLETQLNEAKTSIKQFSDSLQGVKKNGNEAADGLESVNKKLNTVVLLEAAEALQGVSEKLLEVGKAAMDSALSFGDSQTNLQANLGLTTEEAEKLNGVVEEVFKNGVVGSVDEASQAVMLVKRTFKDLDDTQLEKLTNNITTIAKRTGTDVNENVRSAEQLMNAFGISGEKATDLIAKGFQSGLNRSGDFLDTLTEYSPHFQNAGFSAEQMLQIINNGMENGAMNTDKAADAVKEFQIKLGDGSFEKIMGDFSKDTENTFKKWQDGKATVADVANSVSKDLNKMTPSEQQKALSALSSQFEDLGVDGAAALFNVGDAFTDVNGKADEMSKKSPGEEWESSLRELQSALLPIGQTLVDSLSPVIEGLAKLGEWFGKLPGPIQTFITIFGALITIAGIAMPVILGVAAAVSTLEVTLLPIIAVIVAVIAAIALIIVIIKNWGAITDWLGKKWDQFKTWLSETTGKMKEYFLNKFTEMKDGAVNKVTELKDKAISTIVSFKDNAVNKVVDLKNAFINKIASLKDGAVDKFNSLRDKAGSVMLQTKEKILSPIESARAKISEIIGKIKGFFTGLKLNIPTPSLPKLPHFSLEMSSKTILGKTIKYPTGFDVTWRAKGAIFTEPTIFGMNNGQLQGAGEAGPEAALPLNEETLGAIGRGIASTMADNRPIILQIDGKTIASFTRDHIDKGLQDKARFENLGIGRKG